MLIVTQDVLVYTALVSSQFTYGNDSITEYITINSNIKGEILAARIYDDERILMEYTENNPITFVKRKSKSNYNRKPSLNYNKYSTKPRKLISDILWELSNSSSIIIIGLIVTHHIGMRVNQHHTN